MPERHYSVPPPERVDLGDILTLIARMSYFVLDAPRQAGKDLYAASLGEPAERPRRAPSCLPERRGRPSSSREVRPSNGGRPRSAGYA